MGFRPVPNASFAILSTIVAVLAVAPACAQEPRELTVIDAVEALQKGNPKEAVRLTTELLSANDPNTSAYWVRAKAYEALSEFGSAVDDYAALLEHRPDDPQLLNAIGSAAFKNADMRRSIEAFDAAIEQEPAQAPHHWQRGISYYYAKQFEDGEKQFQIHRTVNPQDVENSVWHFLCAVPLIGTVNARAQLIPIDNDARVPMMQIYELFRGKASEADVMARASEASSDAERAGQMFYAHLYLGLYHEAYGRKKLAAEHIAKAVHDYSANHYMWHVARVHEQIRKGG